MQAAPHPTQTPEYNAEEYERPAQTAAGAAAASSQPQAERTPPAYIRVEPRLRKAA